MPQGISTSLKTTYNSFCCACSLHRKSLASATSQFQSPYSFLPPTLVSEGLATVERTAHCPSLGTEAWTPPRLCTTKSQERPLDQITLTKSLSRNRDSQTPPLSYIGSHTGTQHKLGQTYYPRYQVPLLPPDARSLEDRRLDRQSRRCVDDRRTSLPVDRQSDLRRRFIYRAPASKYLPFLRCLDWKIKSLASCSFGAAITPIACCVAVSALLSNPQTGCRFPYLHLGQCPAERCRQPHSLRATNQHHQLTPLHHTYVSISSVISSPT